MAAGTMIAVAGVYIKSPSGYVWDIEDNSASDAGRVQDGSDTMYKNRTSQKRKLSLTWTGITKEEASAILQAFNPEYIYVTYPDTMSGNMETREFYAGASRSATLKTWFVNKKIYSSLSTCNCVN